MRLACSSFVILAACGGSNGPSAADIGFRGSGDERPAGYTGPAFELSRDYPEDDPGDCRQAGACPWLQVEIDVDDTDWSTGGWDRYMKAILDHLVEGQEPDLQPAWNVDVDGSTRWFHVPWMAYDPSSGREFIHGLTNERTAHLEDFVGSGGAPLRGAATNGGISISGLPGFETWAFGVYNAWGGYTLGQMWGDDGRPRVDDGDIPRGLPFAEGTLVVKLLFTTATHLDAPYLEGSPEWLANRHVLVEAGSDSSGSASPTTATTPTTAGGVTLQYDSTIRAPQPVRLVQMDVAARDERTPTKWVYGTFGYNGTLEGRAWWERMSPLGTQWGADPERWPATTTSGDAQETSLAPINIYEHEGCRTVATGTPTMDQKRLAGPVDNRVSACMACHGAAYAGPLGEVWRPADYPPIFFASLCAPSGRASQSQNTSYFGNYPFTAAGQFTEYPGFASAKALDTSLQIQIALRQYGCFNATGSACE